MKEKSLFASNSLLEHLLRGVAGISALVSALMVAKEQPWLSVGLGVLTLIAFRGCPICWTTGLIETGYRAIHKHRGQTAR